MSNIKGNHSAKCETSKKITMQCIKHQRTLRALSVLMPVYCTVCSFEVWAHRGKLVIILLVKFPTVNYSQLTTYTIALLLLDLPLYEWT